MENSSLEMLPIVDERGEVTGCAPRSECHGGSMLLHPVVHLHVINNAGELLLQRRSLSKKIQPGKWDTAVGGHVDYGEPAEVALRREAAEEIGLTDFEYVKIAEYTFASDVEREYVHCHIATTDDDFKPVAEESDIDELRFWPVDELLACCGRGVLTPNFESEFKSIILPYLQR